MEGQKQRSRAFRFLVAFVAPVAVAGLTQLTWPFFEQTPASLFFLAVMFSAWYGGFWPGLLSVFVSFLLADYFFIAPYYEFWPPGMADLVTLVTLVTVGSFISALSESMHRARQHAESSLHSTKRAEENLATTLDSIGDAVIATDKEGRVIRMNPVAEQLTGWPLEEAKGRPLGEVFRIVNEDTRQLVESPVARVMREGTVVGLANHTILLARDGTELPVADSGAPIRDPQGEIHGVVLVFRDQSAERRTEEMRIKSLQLEAQNLRIEEANRLKSEFLANMSHELRTPLNAMIGFTGTLLMRLPGPLTPDQHKQLNTIQTSARHLLSLINDLLDLSKIESGKVEIRPKLTSCAGVIEEVAMTLRPLAEEKGLELRLALPKSDIAIRSDWRALSQILINLADNAIKFTEQGGVVIALEQHNDSGRMVTQISISDTGCGITSEDQTKLFQAFAQLDSSSTRRHEGTGLGLHLSQRLAALLGGHITLESQYGRGSTFTLVIPEK